MAEADVVIRNARVVTPAGVIRGGVAVKGEKISAVACDDGLPSAREVVDAGGKILCPGGVDSHVHIPLYEGRHRGDFAREGRAALAGGTTCVVDFVKRRAQDGFGLAKSYRDAVRRAGEEACVDFAFHVVVWDPEDVAEIGELVGLGVASFKHIMACCNGRPGIGTGLQYASFRQVARWRGIASVHAENEDIQSYWMAEMKGAGRSDPLGHALSRPVVSEVEAICRAVLMAEDAGCPLHVFHLSSGRGLEVINEARRRGVAVTTETCPHYLLFTREDLDRLGPFLQVNPPVKEDSDRRALWRGLQTGAVQAVVSDHYAPLREEKESGWTDIWSVEAGVPGIGTRAPLLMSEGVLGGRIGLERFAELISTGPARLFGLYPRKGAIVPGADADLVLWDPEAEMVLSAGCFGQTADWTPYQGMRVRGLPVLVLLRGRVVMREGRVDCPAGYGRHVPAGGGPEREAAGPVAG